MERNVASSSNMTEVQLVRKELRANRCEFLFTVPPLLVDYKAPSIVVCPCKPIRFLFLTPILSKKSVDSCEENCSQKSAPEASSDLD